MEKYLRPEKVISSAKRDMLGPTKKAEVAGLTESFQPRLLQRDGF